MSNEYKKHITGTLISKLADGLVFGLSIVLTTGCEKLSEKYGVKEEQKYGPEMLNERNYIPSESGYDLNEADNGGKSHLHIAVEKGDLAKVKLLIEDQRTDLNATCKKGKTPIYRASELNKVEIVKLLIEDQRTDLNKQDNDGNAPIHIAAHIGCPEIVQVLLGSSTIVLNAKNKHNETALSISFGESHKKEGHKKVCKLLLEANKLLLKTKRDGCDTCCSICQSHPCIDDLYITRCSHFFHKACLEKWHQTQQGRDKNCPVCRQTIKRINLR